MGTVLIFKSTHDVIKARRALDKARLDYEIVPTPKAVSSECGMSLRVSELNLEQARILLQAAEVRYRDDLL